MAYVNNKALYYQQFLRRENGTRHHKYDEELQMYNMIRDGNMDAVKVAKNLFLSELSGHLSDTPLKNYKYLFIASITLATRFSIEGGMDEEDAYTASDLYIQRVDSCQDVDTVVRLYEDMIGFFTSHVSEIPKCPPYSKPVLTCMDYVYYHLHEKLSLEVLSSWVKLHPNYLAGLFKKETGMTISQYITDRRMKAAKNMLLYSDTPQAEIASILAFNSQSHFIQIFRKTYGMTPKKYRERFFESAFARSGLSERYH